MKIKGVLSLEEKRYLKVVDNIRNYVSGYINSEYGEKIILAVVGFLSGLVCSRGVVFGKYSPFGVAVVASVPKKSMWAAAAGTMIGYLLPSAVYVPARYLGAVLAVLAIRWALSELKSINTRSLFAPLITLAPMLLTGLLVVLINGTMAHSAALHIAESFLAAGCAYFLNRSYVLFERRKHQATLDGNDATSIMITVCIFILSLSGVTIEGVSIGRIAMVLMVVYSARIGGISAGAVSGVAAGVIQGLATAGLSYLSGAYGLGGLMAGVFAPMGKLATAAAFIIAHTIASLQVNDTKMVLAGAVEVAAATILYMALPKSRYISEIFNVKNGRLSGDSFRKNIVLRLNHAGEALNGIYTSVDEISNKLSEIAAPDMQGVYNKAVENICTGCGKSTLCWRKYKAETTAAFSGLTAVLKQEAKISTNHFSKEFLDRCGRQNEMRDEVNKSYARLLAKQEAEIRSAQVREVVESHFKTTAGILTEMADEFGSYLCFDEEAAQRVADVLRNNGIIPIDVCCRIDKFDRMSIEAEIENKRERRINRAVLTKEISAACGRAFSPPCTSTIQGKCRLQMCQRAELDVVRGFSQYSANGGAFCGDCASVFYDGNGRLISIISDGMGTGGRAAVDGAMATAMAESLIRAGIGFDSTLKTLNSALIAKSGEETLATLDITSVDLFTGETEFRKAGAAGTVLKRGKRIEFIESSSMPAGIMPDVEFALTKKNLESGDLIVMISDGVIANGSEWLLDFIEDMDEETEPNDLAEKIADKARAKRTDGHEDDVSVLVLSLT